MERSANWTRKHSPPFKPAVGKNLEKKTSGLQLVARSTGDDHDHAEQDRLQLPGAGTTEKIASLEKTGSGKKPLQGGANKDGEGVDVVENVDLYPENLNGTASHSSSASSTWQTHNTESVGMVSATASFNNSDIAPTTTFRKEQEINNDNFSSKNDLQNIKSPTTQGDTSSGGTFERVNQILEMKTTNKQEKDHNIDGPQQEAFLTKKFKEQFDKTSQDDTNSIQFIKSSVNESVIESAAVRFAEVENENINTSNSLYKPIDIQADLMNAAAALRGTSSRGRKLHHDKTSNGSSNSEINSDSTSLDDFVRAKSAYMDTQEMLKNKLITKEQIAPLFDVCLVMHMELVEGPNLKAFLHIKCKYVWGWKNASLSCLSGMTLRSVLRGHKQALVSPVMQKRSFSCGIRSTEA